MSIVDCVIKKVIYDVKTRFSSPYPIESCRTWFKEIFVEYAFV